MPQEYIELRGARENNLKNVSLRIPKRKITIFTGVSGSGKSSMVFDTIATEAQRLLNENFSMFVRSFLPRYAQPDADAIENLSMAIVVDQKRLGGGSHSTVGTVTDINTVLRLLFSRVGKPFVGPSNVFGFNDPQGMCPECNGLGRKLSVDLNRFLDTSKSLNEGAILFPEYAIGSWGLNLCIQTGLFDPDKKLSKYTDKEMDLLLYSKPMKVKTKVAGKDFNPTFEGIANRFSRKYIKRDLKTMPERTQNISVDIPTGVLTVVAGVAGSGKSSLINQTLLKQHPDAIVIDQSPVGISSRSNPATYTGIMDDVRKAFAAANKVNPSLFSFNSKGACENCQGLGVIYTDVAFLSEVKTPCEICGGKRFKDEVLAYKLNGKSISDVLAMTVQEALEFFEIPEVVRKLQAMSDVGLDYLSLGQPLSTLSGGECQRIKLASELHKKGSIYIMDEPTTGLHMSDISHLLAVIDRLVDTGNTVVVIEHNMHIIKNADWIIDMGPEGGSKGGTIIFEGTPRNLLGVKRSFTSAYLHN